MDNKANFVSFVIWLSNENFRTTIDSILELDNIRKDGKAENIQIVILKSSSVDLSAAAGEPFYRFLPDWIDMTIAEGEYDDMPSAYQAALNYINGRYVCFAACGSAYKSGLITELDISLKGAPDTKLLCVLCDKSGDNQNAHDINRGFRRRAGRVDINEKYNVPFIFLSNLFINTELELSFDKRLTVVLDPAILIYDEIAHPVAFYPAVAIVPFHDIIIVHAVVVFAVSVFAGVLYVIVGLFIIYDPDLVAVYEYIFTVIPLEAGEIQEVGTLEYQFRRNRASLSDGR